MKIKSTKKVSFGNDVKVKLVKKIYKNNKQDEWLWICSVCDNKNNKRICTQCGGKNKAKNTSRSVYSHKLGGKNLKFEEKVIDIDLINDDDNLHFGSYLVGTCGDALIEGLWIHCTILEVDNNTYLVGFEGEDGSEHHHVLKENFKPLDIEMDISYEDLRYYFNNLSWR